jgi:hypothetical protein
VSVGRGLRKQRYTIRQDVRSAGRREQGTERGPPARLLGTYTTTLKKSDLPTPVPPELQGQDRWTLKITKAGGIENAPTLTIVRPPSDVLESSTLSVSGDTLRLSDEECAQATGYAIVTSASRWRREGDTLRLTSAKGGCPDKVAQTILTSELWTRS